MRIGIMGAGGVGSGVGAHLARGAAAAGIDVALIARGPHLAAMKATGLQVTSPNGDFAVPELTVTDTPTAAGPFDVVLLTVKLYDLEDAARRIAPALANDGFVVTVQNGVSAARDVGVLVGADRVVAGATFISSFVTAPGMVGQKSPDVPVVFGEPDGRMSPRVKALAAAGVAAGVQFKAVPDIQSALWRKFVALTGFSAVGCLARATIGDILADDALRVLFRRAMAETVAVGQAEGVPLPEDLVDQLTDHVGAYAPEARGSMQEDLTAGRRLEVNWISGEVVRLGRRHGIDTPVHQTAAACLMPCAAGQK